MSILVRNKGNNNIYYLVSASYSFYKDPRPTLFGVDHEEGEIKMAAVCNKNGDIEWFPTEELKVIEIDGVKVSDLFDNPEFNVIMEDMGDKCPACGAVVSTDAAICSSCGLTLIVDEDHRLPY